MSVAEKLEIWVLLRAGTSFRVIGRRLGRSDATISSTSG
jgi:IS30 family transposase